MGLLDRINSEEEIQRGSAEKAEKRTFAPVQSKFTVEDPFADVKEQIHNAIVAQQIRENRTVDDDDEMKDLMSGFHHFFFTVEGRTILIVLIH